MSEEYESETDFRCPSCGKIRRKLFCSVASIETGTLRARCDCGKQFFVFKKVTYISPSLTAREEDRRQRSGQVKMLKTVEFTKAPGKSLKAVKDVIYDAEVNRYGRVWVMIDGLTMDLKSDEFEWVVRPLFDGKESAGG
jgi:hypothetical protein